MTDVPLPPPLPPSYYPNLVAGVRTVLAKGATPRRAIWGHAVRNSLIPLATGIGGIVRSPNEAQMARDIVGPALQIATPGIRPAGAALGDQKRVMGPAEAIAAGATHLVVGRPITAAADPVAAAQAILAEMAGGGTRLA